MAEVHVAVGVILDRDQRILLTRRADKAHQGGLWEFPGGKVEAGEDVLQALDRELREELAISVAHSAPLIAVRHDYGDKAVLLDVHLVRRFSGEPKALEGQPMAWVAVADLPDYDFPAANVPIVEAVTAALQ
ncbi:8-oxo-dGTP diphosphatase MutT [Parahaliea aestuarii]|uniref:8-oxo-dGTP diphosphatase n=1 Tax=Parahaliea aestuarii TaxID=1852021 RepID=A0A5C9A4P8_9GAMM|nr:8-oxo-dGTP diphosphatase MutT [Parahaliea aestuarii]TXS94952.1 8-oxo-dGTP diphosphatase MutT [Parahaliea aestuarii]